jgi:hypothetical protein
MTNSDTIIAVGPLRARLGTVAAFLYGQIAEQPPMQEPIQPGENASEGRMEQYQKDMAHYNTVMEAWYAPRMTSSPVISLSRVETLLHGLGGLLERLQTLPVPLDEEAVQYEFYEAAKATFGSDRAEIREFFMYLYQIVTRTPNGPRWGQFICLFGLDNFLEVLQDRFDNPWS